MSEVSEELDYSKKVLSHAEYKLVALTQQSGGQTVTITSGQSMTEFNIPIECVNFAQSHLSFTATPAADAAKANFLFRDCLAGVHRLELFARSGAKLCDIMHVGNYTKACLKSEFKMGEFRTKDIAGVAPGWSDLMAPSELLAASNLKPEAKADTASVAYTEPLYMTSEAKTVAGPVLNFKIKLGDIKNTVFSVDKSLMFSEQLVLRITWASRESWGFMATEANDPVTGAAAIANNIALSNLQLFIAQETNPDVLSALKSKSVPIPIPYVHVNKANITGADQSVVINISPDMGKTLKRVYHAVFPNSESLNARYSITNVAGTKFTSYYSMVNGSRLQPQDLLIANGEDWMNNKKLIEGSVLGQKQLVYKYNWVHIDSFDGGNNDNNVISGTPIKGNGLTYQFIARGCTAQFNHYDFIVCQKMLSMSPSGVHVH